MKKINQTLALFLFAFLFMNSSANAYCEFAQQLTVKEVEVGNLISWATSLEEEHQLFFVEKSEDGINYETLGEIPGNGNSEEIVKYRFLDVSLGSKKTYYRLKLVEFSGDMAFSPTVLTNRASINDYMVKTMSGTITDKLFAFSLESTKEGLMTCSVVGKLDKVYLKKEQEIYIGHNTVNVNLEKLDNGRYKLLLDMDGETEEITLNKVDRDKVPQVNFARKD